MNVAVTVDKGVAARIDAAERRRYPHAAFADGLALAGRAPAER